MAKRNIALRIEYADWLMDCAEEWQATSEGAGANLSMGSRQHMVDMLRARKYHEAERPAYEELVHSHQMEREVMLQPSDTHKLSDLEKRCIRVGAGDYGVDDLESADGYDVDGGIEGIDSESGEGD
jgi:hypothetical protein